MSKINMDEKSDTAMGPAQSKQRWQGARRAGDTALQTFYVLRGRILNGDYHPEQWLAQEQLSEELGVGRTPIREALRMLEIEGLVHSLPHKGVTVASASPSSMEEFYAIRLLLEPPTLALTVDSFGKEDFDEMDNCLTRMRSAAEGGRLAEFQEAHLAFHLVGLRNCGNETLAKIVVDLFQKVARLQRVYMSKPSVPEDVVALDSLLLSSIRESAENKCRCILEFHLLEMALGMILDVDPDYVFGPLLRASMSCGITLETGSDGRMIRPVGARWLPSRGMLSLETSDLRVTN